MIGIQNGILTMQRPLISDPETHVVAIAGQSNAAGFDSLDVGAATPAGVLQYGYTGAIVPAGEHLLHNADNHNAALMGFNTQFAIDYLKARPHVTLVFVPAARNNTAFDTGFWQAPGGAGATTLRDRVNACMTALGADAATYPTPSFKGVLWLQGETDALIGAAGGGASDPAVANYASRLDELIAWARTGITASSEVTPWILAGLAPNFVAKEGEAGAAVQAAIVDTPNRTASTVFIDSADLDDKGDNTHFSAASLRALGARYAVALVSGTSPQPPVWALSTGQGSVTFDTIPSAPGAPTVSAGDGAVTFI